MSTAERAAARLTAERSALARAITDALYAELPQLQEKYGDRGRARCLEDMHFNLEHLAPAVELGRPEMFTAYVHWLDGLLRARNVDTREIVRSLALTERVLRERFAAEELDAILPALRAGVAALDAEASA